MDYYKAVRPLIYTLTPEQAHAGTIAMLRLAGSNGATRWILDRLFQPARGGPVVEAFGLRFSNPIGMAAGYDKDGLGWRGLACLGFGHIELGTVTPLAQPGNPLPRVFRLVEDKAVINRMGFPGKGAEFLARRLQGSRPAGLLLGVNLGKNKATPLEAAAVDYTRLVEVFAPLADYLAVNVSSPNTPGLRSLQSRQALEGILSPVNTARLDAQKKLGKRVPVLVKLAPDLEEGDLDGALEAVFSCGMDGVIAANTTLRRDGLRSPLASETGGMSGAPLGVYSQEFLLRVLKRLNGSLPVIASGGVMDAAGARQRLDAGAVLVQLYTGLIYSGPGLVKTILDSGL